MTTTPKVGETIHTNEALTIRVDRPAASILLPQGSSLVVRWVLGPTRIYAEWAHEGRSGGLVVDERGDPAPDSPIRRPVRA